MRIRRIRIALPARLKGDAAQIGRQIAAEIGQGIAGHEDAAPTRTIRLDGQGRPALLLVRAVGAALPGRR
jgi:hypothetical protein